jgi:hypothetical protein
MQLTIIEVVKGDALSYNLSTRTVHSSWKKNEICSTFCTPAKGELLQITRTEHYRSKESNILIGISKS